MNRVYRMLAVACALLLTAEVQAQAAQTMPENAGAEVDADVRKEIEARIAEITSSEAIHDEEMELGRARTVLCKTCHGEDGTAVKPMVPNLAGQNPAYIVDQFTRFKDGRRYDFMMSNLAKTLKTEDKFRIALYYASLPPRASGGGRTELIPQGKKVFQEHCTKCHGDDAKGHEGYARLAGQQPDYIIKMLKEFRDRTGRRFNPWMSAVALQLTDVDMEAVAAYLASIE